ncbi:uncharacterized protein LOC127119965 [Lathyrus oleraceus]|uniref:uncharacterized protein LOC127119965 n=1 Tax=Pisum sativum TaxID=3888 RepID=UPI0021D11EEA|nr:uncharacterized protein LOC127119965 [Pisum sativum]XP_050906303.1 uncharacterized protein LOC127119965 [Pisum sativum]
MVSGDDGRPSSGSIFVGGFVLGSLIVGALGCVYAPKISETLAGADTKKLMRKLPKFIYDEQKALEIHLSTSYPHDSFRSYVPNVGLSCSSSDQSWHAEIMTWPKQETTYPTSNSTCGRILNHDKKTRQMLSEKIAQLNSTIDVVSAQLRPDQVQHESAKVSEEIGVFPHNKF